MINLFNSKDYYWSLFIGHLVIEKLLKAVYARRNSGDLLPIHDLTRLAERSRIEVGKDRLDILDTITTFNIRARYDDYKRTFYLRCTSEFTKEWIDKIGALREWIKQELLPQ